MIGVSRNRKNPMRSLRSYLYPNVKFEVLSNEIQGIPYVLIVVERQGAVRSLFLKKRNVINAYHLSLDVM